MTPWLQRASELHRRTDNREKDRTYGSGMDGLDNASDLLEIYSIAICWQGILFPACLGGFFLSAALSAFCFP